jgi:ferredoxin like protein
MLIITDRKFAAADTLTTSYILDRAIEAIQACVECGSYWVGCPFNNIGWALPRGGYGVAYKFG